MSPATRRRSGALAGLLMLSTLGEGGASPSGLVIWHALLVVLLVLELSLPDPNDATTTLSRRALWPFCLFFLVAVVGSMRAPYGYAAWLFLLELGAFGGVAWLASRRGPGLLRDLAVPLLAAAAAQSLWMLTQKFLLGVARPAGEFLNPNHLAAWLVAVLLLCWGGLLAPSNRSPTRLATLAGLSLPVLLALVLSGSRGALLGLLAGLVSLIVMLWGELSRKWRRAILAAVAVVILLVGSGVALRQRQDDPFRYQRLAIWRASLGIVLEDPLFGSGPRQFAYAARNHQFPDGDGPLRYDRGFRTTHSDWLRVPGELGLPGLLVAGVGVAICASEIRRRRRSGELRAERLAAAAALVALGFQATVDNLSSRPAIYVLAGALVGALTCTRGPRPRLPAALRWTAAAGLVGVFLVGDVGPWLAWREVHDLPAGGRLDDAQRARLERASSLNRAHPDYPRRRAEHLSAPGAGWGIPEYVAARESAEHAVRLHGAGSEYHRTLAQVEARACRTLFRDVDTRERARAAFERAEQLDRLNPFIPIERAGFLLDTGDPLGAARAAERALRIEPESVLPRLMLAGALLEIGDASGARRAAALLEQARDKAVRWKAWAETSPYARELLVLDEDAVGRIERALARRSYAR